MHCTTCSTAIDRGSAFYEGRTEGRERPVACSIACADIEAARRHDDPFAVLVVQWERIRRPFVGPSVRRERTVA